MAAHAPDVKQSVAPETRDPPGRSDSPPTLKPEPLSTASPSIDIKPEVVVVPSSQQHNRPKTTSGSYHQHGTPKVASNREMTRPPPRKRKLELCSYAVSSTGCGGGAAEKQITTTNTGIGGELLPVENGTASSKPKVKKCSIDQSPPDITVDESPNAAQQRKDAITVDGRDYKSFVQAPRKRFRYEFLSYVNEDGAVANEQITAAEAAGKVENSVINLTTTTSTTIGVNGTRDVAVQCTLTSIPTAGSGVSDPQTSPGFTVDPRGPSFPRPSTVDQLTTSLCWYCGIVFDDDVLHAIHMGCHSVADRFVCNVCGLACGDRYGFNSHLVRGHVQAATDQLGSILPGPGSQVLGSQVFRSEVLPLQLPSTARLVPQTSHDRHSL